MGNKELFLTNKILLHAKISLYINSMDSTNKSIQCYEVKERKFLKNLQNNITFIATFFLI